MIGNNDWAAAAGINYTPITTFWLDFSLAEPFGEKGIKDTAKRAFDEWYTNVKYLTELIMVLNHKSWYWNGKNDDFTQLYADLYYKYDEKAIECLSKEDLGYYFNTLD